MVRAAARPGGVTPHVRTWSSGALKRAFDLGDVDLHRAARRDLVPGQPCKVGSGQPRSWTLQQIRCVLVARQLTRFATSIGTDEVRRLVHACHDYGGKIGYTLDAILHLTIDAPGDAELLADLADELSVIATG